jgi:hypothetical protein
VGNRRSIVVILCALLVASISFVMAAFLPVADSLKAFFGFPGVLALLGVLFQLWRDSQSHARALELQVRQQDFVLGTATHMAEVAYDKHVDFCEEYVARTNRGLQDMFVDGPTEAALEFAHDLTDIRVRYRTWLTQEIEDDLIPFEQTIREIGAKRVGLRELPVGDERSEVVRAMHVAFMLVSGLNKNVGEEQRAMTSAHVVEALRGVLGIRELTALRSHSAKLALKRLVGSP